MSKEEWLRHMRSKHSMACWKCPFTDTSPRCSERRFSTKETWMHHIIQLHNEEDGSITDSQLQILAGINLTTEMSIQQCPICGFRGKEDIQSDLINHIATHLHSFSLKALPWSGSLDKSSESQTSTRRSPVRIGPSTNNFFLRALLHEIVKYLTWFLDSLGGYRFTLTLGMMAADW
jgi:hypothetical protein